MPVPITMNHDVYELEPSASSHHRFGSFIGTRIRHIFDPSSLHIKQLASVVTSC